MALVAPALLSAPSDARKAHTTLAHGAVDARFLLAGRDRLQPLVQCRWNSSGAPLVRALWQGGAWEAANESPREDTTRARAGVDRGPGAKGGAGRRFGEGQGHGICGTDLHIDSWDEWAQRTLQPPVTVGHEFSGEVVQIGASVTDVAVGDLVSGETPVCGRCRNCRAGRRHLCIHTRAIGVHLDGAFAEYLALPSGNAWVHRDPIDAGVAAIFDPFGNAVHTALAFPMLGEDVLVTGAGPIGIMAGMVSKHAGARHVVITDRSEERLAPASTLG